MDTFLTIAGGMWWRVGRHLDLFPWRLWHVVNPEMSVAEKRKQHADRLVRCCPSCVDPWFTRPLLDEYGATDIARIGSIAHEKVLTSLQKCRATNVMSELRFARLTKHMVPNRYGRAPSIPSMATKHTLAELASMQHRAVAKWEKEEAVPKIDAPEWTSKASSSWHAFFKAKRREGLGMKDIGELWRSLGEEEKHAFRSLASDQSAACKPYEDLHEPMPFDRTPLGIGDMDMPVREEIAAQLAEGNEVYRRADLWRGEVRKVSCGLDVSEADAPTTTQCGEVYGCATEFTDEVKARCAELRGRLRTAVKALKGEKHLPLLLLQGCRRGEAAEVASEPCPLFIALVVFKLLQDPEVFRAVSRVVPFVPTSANSRTSETQSYKPARGCMRHAAGSMSGRPCAYATR